MRRVRSVFTLDWDGGVVPSVRGSTEVQMRKFIVAGCIAALAAAPRPPGRKA